MAITGIGAIGSVAGLTQQEKKDQTSGVSFSDMLTNAIKDADEAYVQTEEDTKALLAGEVDNLAQVMINSTKAELSLNMVIQVRNKVIDAYNEIMRMQV